MPAPDTQPVRYQLHTPPPGVTGGAAIAIIHLLAPSALALDAALLRLGVAPLPVGRAARCQLAGIDDGVAARWSPTAAQLMPHGGAAILDALERALRACGLVPAEAPLDPRDRYPEASDLPEACALDALAGVTSDLAIDVLLRQRDLWREALCAQGSGTPARELGETDQRTLGWLLRPPTVVLAGRPNIGKSTLTNALAGRAVSIVADEPGTTRDHVGVTLDLAGLTVRWVDAPGLREGPPSTPEQRAIELARDLIRGADLVILGADAGAPTPPPVGPGGTPALCAWLRADLGGPPAGAGWIAVCACTGQGLGELCERVRDTLVPPGLLQTTSLWRFHPALPALGGGPVGVGG